MKKVLNMAKKTTDKKPRNEFIEFYVDDFEGKLELKYNFDEDSLEIENQIIDSAKVETSYKKTSGKLKRTNSTPPKVPNYHLTVIKQSSKILMFF